MPFLILSTLFLLFPSWAKRAWPLLVLYTEAFLLYQYWVAYA